MNPADLIIGLGLGILITLIARIIVDSISEKRLKQRNHDRATQELYESMRNDVDSLASTFNRYSQCIEKLDSVKSKIKLIVERIDQHAGRIEKLEGTKR